MGDIAIRTKKTLAGEDERWKGAGATPGVSYKPPMGIILDRSGFDLVTAFPNGFIPSGIVLAKVTSTGLYVPYANQVSEIQKVTVATSGNTTVTFQGVSTAALSIAADAAGATALTTALEGLPDVEPGDVVVTVGAGGDAGKLIVTFGGQWAGRDVPALSASGTGASAATTTAGGTESPTGEGRAWGHLNKTVAYDRDSTGDLSATLYYDGLVIENYLPTGHGLDDAAKADLGGVGALGHIAYTTNVV